MNSCSGEQAIVAKIDQEVITLLFQKCCLSGRL